MLSEQNELSQTSYQIVIIHFKIYYFLCNDFSGNGKSIVVVFYSVGNQIAVDSVQGL